MGLLSKFKKNWEASQGHDCCAPNVNRHMKARSTPGSSDKEICSSCNTKGTPLPPRTVRFHLKAPWKHTLSDSNYGYCGNSDCETVYFTVDGSKINTNEVKVSALATSANPLICHCFNITKSDIENETPPGSLKKYVIEQTKQNNCACEMNNPSGRCCLMNFPK